MSVPRSEYPRPQFVRDEWECLNGTWQFEIDAGDSGHKRDLLNRELKSEILVPFCPESELSGIEEVDFMNCVWYRREVDIPAAWAGKKVLLHFQACDYDTTVWVNGEMLVRHRGGWAPFSGDMSKFAAAGEKATIVVRARDNTRNNQAGGKQSDRFEKYSCLYTRTTGIWQTVWMEPVAQVHLKRPRITPDLARRTFRIDQPLSNNPKGFKFRATVSWEGNGLDSATVAADLDFAPSVELTIPESQLHLWGPGKGNLYDIELELLDADGNVVDRAMSYAGMRSTSIDGKAVKINGKAVFQRQVLDQGYYRDGILTAPSEQALIDDIELSFKAGFNSARLHQKVFEERFLYHCDRLGYLVWGEFGDWGIDRNDPPAVMITEWLEVLERDYNHPSIIGWCGLNETHWPMAEGIQKLDDVTRGIFLAAKAMDLTRPVLDASGYAHRVPETDVYDSHDYQQDPEKFAANHTGMGEDKPFINDFGDGVLNLPYEGQPYFVSEFGGIWWNPESAAKDNVESWGYGTRPKDIEEWYDRFDKLCTELLANEHMFGYCYTQLTDVWQEENGIYFFDRSEKFDMARVHKVQTQVAAIEKKFNTCCDTECDASCRF
jgi:beta-galactosidase/beta-glucuronidase